MNKWAKKMNLIWKWKKLEKKEAWSDDAFAPWEKASAEKK